MAIVDLPEPPLLFPTTMTRAFVMGIPTGRLSQSRTKWNVMNASNLPDSTNLDKSRRNIVAIEIGRLQQHCHNLNRLGGLASPLSVRGRIAPADAKHRPVQSG
ncbi:hypothetical protein [Bradyrhizobium sp. USDA 4451]